MVFPLGDDNADRLITPYVNYTLIVINILVFVFLQGMGESDFTYKFSTVPKEIVTGVDQQTDPQIVRHPETGREIVMPGLLPTPVSVYLTLLTSMFMHGGIAHIAGNMWFLWIFGDNVEDDMGHLRYTLFYLLTGVIASLCHVFMNAWGDSALVPSLGASGAISGVMGAYLVLHPHRKVQVVLLRMLTVVPGYVAVGMWFVFQVVSGLGLLGGKSGGIAYAAHIGGFIAGLVLAKPFTFGRVIRDKIPVHRDRWR